jgi:hypothetical protein
MHCNVKLSRAEQEYLSTCARIRGISITRLLSRLVTDITKDQLVLSILDDESKQSPECLPGEQGRSRYRPHRL